MVDLVIDQSRKTLDKISYMVKQLDNCKDILKEVKGKPIILVLGAPRSGKNHMHSFLSLGDEFQYAKSKVV